MPWRWYLPPSRRPSREKGMTRAGRQGHACQKDGSTDISRVLHKTDKTPKNNSSIIWIQSSRKGQHLRRNAFADLETPGNSWAASGNRKYFQTKCQFSKILGTQRHSEKKFISQVFMDTTRFWKPISLGKSLCTEQRFGENLPAGWKAKRKAETG